MSDVMLLGVLRMPLEVDGGPLSPMAQLVQRARQAADRIEADAAGIARLTAEVAASQADAQALRVDAERLKTLIDTAPGELCFMGTMYRTGADFCAAIDSFMAHENAKPGSAAADTTTPNAA